MKWVLLIAAATGCGGDDLPGVDAQALPDLGADTLTGDLFGEPCTQPTPPEIGICREGAGACNDEAGGSVCRPFCDVEGEPSCDARGGVEIQTDRGACVCVPA